MFDNPYTSQDLSLPDPLPGATARPRRSLLERLLSPLDWGRQSVMNFGEGLGELGQGNIGTGFAKMAPGVGGILAGALTGGVAGPLVGAGIASLLQGTGNEISPETMRAMTTQDLVTKFGGDPESTWNNLAVGAATDPWMYALGGMGLMKGATAAGQAGERVGAQAGAKLGRWLEQAQLARGPRYSTTPEQLARMINMTEPEAAAALADNAPVMERVASEIHPGSVRLPGTEGAETALLRTPSGSVVKIDPAGALLDYGESGYGIPRSFGRPVSEGLVQPYRSVRPAYAYRRPLIEHMPYASPLPMTETEAGLNAVADARAAHQAEWLGSVARTPQSDAPGAMSILGPQHHLTQPTPEVEQALAVMIGENSGDMGPRLVYADWLEDQGRAMDALRQRHLAEMTAALDRGPFSNITNTVSHQPNLAGVVDGQVKLLSPGHFEGMSGGRTFENGVEVSRTVPRQPVTIGAEPSRIQNALLQALGGDARLQAALEAGHQNTFLPEILAARGKYYGGRGAAVTGGLLGAGLGGGLPVGLRSRLGY